METESKLTQPKSAYSHSLVDSTSQQAAVDNPSSNPVYRQTQCDIDNSNDNHGVTVNNMLALNNEDKFERHKEVVKFKDINFNFSPTVEDNMAFQADRNTDSAEIMISVDIETGELYFDIVSQDELKYIDRDKQTVLASTFDFSVKFKYRDIFRNSIIGMSQSCNYQPSQSSYLENRGRHLEIREQIRQDKSCDTEMDSGSKLPSEISGRPSGSSPGGGDCPAPRTVDCNSKQNCSTEDGPASTKAENRNDRDNDSVWQTCKSFNRGTEIGRNGKGIPQNRQDGRCGRSNDYYWFGDKQFHYRFNRRYQRRDYSHFNRETQNDIIKSRHVISFSESDLIYSSKRKMSDRHYYKAPEVQVKKQITILKRGCTLNDITAETLGDLDRKTNNKDPESEQGSFNSSEIQTDGESVPYGNYSMTITSDRKYYSTKYASQDEVTADDKDLTNADTWTTVKKQKKARGHKGSKQKAKKPKKKVPKTRMEALQCLIQAGQLKSVFSKWKTESLKRIKFVEELHNGTFAIKYKAIYNNEMVVLSVYIDQDTSDINAIDMVHLRNSKFIDGIRDCMTGPFSSLWLLSRYYPNGHLQKLLFKDPDRRVIGEVHSQFITAGLIFAVDYLHQHGIVHGNIKPSKILISRNGFPVLTGYVIVDETILEERRDVYTPAYAAPERFRGHRGTAIDIFSVGCVGYEIVTGRTPFDDGNMNALRSNILDKSYRPLFEPELFSFAGEMFIDSCLRKSLKSRFTIGKYRENFLCEEWFSTLDLYQLERQSTYSPILHVMKQIDSSKSAPLPWCEKTVEFDWGRALDITCPNLEPVDACELQSTEDFLLQFF